MGERGCYDLVDLGKLSFGDRCCFGTKFSSGNVVVSLIQTTLLLTHKSATMVRSFIGNSAVPLLTSSSGIPHHGRATAGDPADHLQYCHQ